MNKLSTLGLVGCLSCCAVSLSAEPVKVAPVPETAAKITQAWAAEFNAHDSAGLAELYTDNAVLMPPSDETLVTRDAVKDYWTKVLTVTHEYDVQIVQAEQKGDVLYAAGIWSAKQTLPNGQALNVGGNVVRVLERQADGEWKLRVEAWN